MTAFYIAETGTRTLMAAQAGLQNMVVSLALTADPANPNTTVMVHFHSVKADTGQITVIAGPFFLGVGQPLVLPWTQHGWFETLPGERLDIDVRFSDGGRLGGVFSGGASQ